MSWDSPTPQPDYRLTCSEGELVLIPWRPGLIERSGPCSQLLLRGALGCVVADLTIVRDAADGYEAILSELTTRSDNRFRQTLTAWAALLGYRRIWCGKDVIEVDALLDTMGGVARTRCRTCGSEWFDDSAEFWLTSRELGAFPLWCPMCGGLLPQWAVEPRLHDGDPIRKIREPS